MRSCWKFKSVFRIFCVRGTLALLGSSIIYINENNNRKKRRERQRERVIRACGPGLARERKAQQLFDADCVVMSQVISER